MRDELKTSTPLPRIHRKAGENYSDETVRARRESIEKDCSNEISLSAALTNGDFAKIHEVKHGFTKSLAETDSGHA